MPRSRFLIFRIRRSTIHNNTTQSLIGGGWRLFPKGLEKGLNEIRDETDPMTDG